MLQGLFCGVVGGVTEVHEHADTVHLVNERESELAEAAPARLDPREEAARVREGVVAGVRQREVTHTEVVVCPEHLDGVPKLMSTFDAEQRCDFAPVDGGLYLVGGECPGECLKYLYMSETIDTNSRQHSHQGTSG